MTNGSPPSPPTALYFHLPFCRKKCHYCDFNSFANKEELIDEYVNALLREIRAVSLPSSLSTIYFGGGTPTLLEPRHFDNIFNSLISHLSLDISHLEISVEANPGTADDKKLSALRELGLNRLSIGIQSFHDQHLKYLGRIHNAAEAISFFAAAREAGFNNINLDLIFAIPGQTLVQWQADLEKALALAPEHLSVYNLQIEEGTPLAALVPRPSPNELDPEMYETAIDTLGRAGYRHYEISNFAKPGYEGRHNINYWKNGNYFGLGAGAHSHLNGQRWANPSSIEDYLAMAKNGNWPFNQIDFSASKPDPAETIFLGLRLLDGLPKTSFSGYEKEVTELVKDGLLAGKNGNYQLTRRGLFLGNLVFEKFV